jgi:putative transcriptional regulator
MNLANHFLIAMPSMSDPNFSQTVTLIVMHDEQGAMGIVVNRPLPLNLGTVLEQMQIPNASARIKNQPIFEGGPVSRDRGFVIHQPPSQWNSTITVSPELAVSTSRDILEAISAGTGPDASLIALGYAGWDAGQLEQEFAANAWLSCPAEESIIFELAPELRWRSAVERLGISIEAISSDVGHA